MSRIRVRTALLAVGVVVASISPGAAAAWPAVPVTGYAGSVTTGYVWPVPGEPVVTRRFDPPERPWLPGHRGVDLAAAPGAEVRAPGPGVVRFAGSVAGRGVVSIDHAAGLRTTYQPVAWSVNAGQRVGTGDPIGELRPGHDGCPAEACLHWGLLRGEEYLDPLGLLGLGRVRLLPVGG